MAEERIYAAIDLKSFYASVECVERNLDPLTANLVVADPTRTEKTICLAVSPSLKSYGIPGRARLFEVIEKVNAINEERRLKAPGHKFIGSSYINPELNDNPSLCLDVVVAPPQMKKYMQVSAQIFDIYMKYAAPEDIHVYSIDEVFIDLTDYLKSNKLTAREMVMKMIQDVLKTTGITATAGIGTNLYLCKIAMDIVAKHIPADKDGVRIAELNERKYRELLWSHRPLTDFWRIGHGYSSKLESMGLFTMGDIARYSLTHSDILFKKFGINAELLIDHAWGYEPTRMQDIKNYHSETNSLSSGQVLPCAYSNDKAKLVIKEMTDLLALDMVEKRVVTDQMVITVGYDISSAAGYKGELSKDFYGRMAPKHSHGSINLGKFTSSSKLMTEAVSELFERITDVNLKIRRMYVVASHVIYEKDIPAEPDFEQLDLFTDYAERDRKAKEEKQELEKERKKQEAILSIKRKYGKNSILKGMNLEEGATAKDRNSQVGGHKA